MTNGREELAQGKTEPGFHFQQTGENKLNTQRKSDFYLQSERCKFNRCHAIPLLIHLKVSL